VTQVFITLLCAALLISCRLNPPMVPHRSRMQRATSSPHANDETRPGWTPLSNQPLSVPA